MYKSPREVDDLDPVARVGLVTLLIASRELDDGAASLTPHQPAALVRGDADHPGPDLLGIAPRAEPSPGDRPRRLDRICGDLGVARDRVRDAGHRRVVLRDEPRERDLVAVSGATHDGRPAGRFGARVVAHAPASLKVGGVSHRAVTARDREA